MKPDGIMSHFIHSYVDSSTKDWIILKRISWSTTDLVALTNAHSVTFFIKIQFELTKN
jgi:hypothetical protein